MNLTKAFITLLKLAGYEVRDYSGRGMYGRECVAVVTDDNGVLLGHKLTVAMQHLSDVESAELGQLVDELRNTNTDSMGYDKVYYWPDIEWERPQTMDHMLEEDNG